MAIMAQDAAVLVRRALSVALKNSPKLPRDIANKLAQDVETIALPIILNSPVLTDSDLVEIVRSCPPSKQVAVASRERLSVQVTGAIAEFAVSAAVLAGSWALLALGQLWLPPAGALAGCLLAYPLWSWRRLEAAQRYLDTELAALRGLAGPFDTGAVQAAPPGSIDPFRARIAVVRDAARRERALQRFVADTLDALPVGVLVADPAGPWANTARVQA